MRKISLALSLATIISIFCLNIASAGYYNNYPEYYYTRGDYSSRYAPTQQGDLSRNYNLNQNYNSRIDLSNFDSSSLGYDYRGPMYERTITYTDDLYQKSSDKSFPFYSRSRDSLRHTISTTLNEKYIGATESLFYNTQNRRQESSSETNSILEEYNEDSSFKKQRLYDRYEYGRDSYTSPYYYRPYYDSRGYYNWRY